MLTTFCFLFQRNLILKDLTTFTYCSMYLLRSPCLNKQLIDCDFISNPPYSKAVYI